ncbi:integrase core domain-containing protein [Deinococcus ruber]|uniref:integrase core domain-containing protein n=1 Tax=Deinococcus ruber TaxID=1848197 RepID=UPI00166434A1
MCLARCPARWHPLHRTRETLAERFHSRLREEFLTTEVFYSPQHAQVLLDGWRAFYNALRPHSSLDYLTPDEFARRSLTPPSPPSPDPVPCS